MLRVRTNPQGGRAMRSMHDQITSAHVIRSGAGRRGGAVVRHRVRRAAVLAALSLVAASAFLPGVAQARTAPIAFSPLHARMLWVSRPAHLGAQPTTWYGPGFWGNRTACGTTLRRGTWGIAHRTLPCGKLVWLRFHGRSIAVPVIDRGPFGYANIDLTQRTADYLGFRRYGRGNVRVAVMRRSIPLWRLR